MDNENNSGIHPAPVEFSNAEIATDPILHFFHYAHLPPRLRETSQAFASLARFTVNNLPRNPERTVALRKLLEAKDAVASEPGEPVVTGGHDEDRDGPVPFDV